jgi:SAM-dependent methyltransferase
MTKSPIYFDRSAGVTVEHDALPRGEGGVVQFTHRHEVEGDAGHAWDDIYSGRWEGQQKRISEEVASAEARWRRVYHLPYYTQLNAIASGRVTGRGLEIGCGTAESAFLLSTIFGWDIYGIDVSASAVGVARQRFSLGGLDPDRLSIAGIEELPFDDGVFDLVFGKTVFEHFEDPDVAAAEIARVTAIGGHVVLDVPNERNAYWTFASERSRGHTHLTNVYTIEALGAYFERQGFRIVERWGEGIFYTTPYILLSTAKRALYRSPEKGYAIESILEERPETRRSTAIVRRILQPVDRVFKAAVRIVNRLADLTGVANPRTGVLIGIAAVRDAGQPPNIDGPI